MSFNYNEHLNTQQVSLKEQIVLEVLRDYSKPIEKRRSMSSIPVHASLDSFIDNTKALIDLDQETSDQRILLLDEYSEQNILQDPEDSTKELSGAVLYSLARRAPGTTAGGNIWFSRERREVKPRIREIIANDPNNLGQTKIIYSQWFDNEVQFSICARTNKRANDLAPWFEDLMEVNRTYFALKGTTRYLLDKRDADVFSQMGNEGYHYRPFCYLVRTEKTYTVTEQAINKIIISLTTNNN